MGKLRIGGCTHCRNGEVFIEHDQYGWYECCLQCGYSRDLPDIVHPALARERSEEKVAVPQRRSRSMKAKWEASKQDGRK